MMAGKEEYLLPRDKGPERALVRDIVDSRRNVGTFFFGGAFLVLLVGFNRSHAPERPARRQRPALGVPGRRAAIDSFLISPEDQAAGQGALPRPHRGLGPLYFYAIMRAITFRLHPQPETAGEGRRHGLTTGRRPDPARRATTIRRRRAARRWRWTASKPYPPFATGPRFHRVGAWRAPVHDWCRIGARRAKL